MKRIVSTALLLLLASLLLSAGAQQQPAPTSLQGTIHALQPKTGSIDIVTGVGMALRLVRVTGQPVARMASGAAGVPVAALKRGDLVRAQCHWAGKQLVADRIDRVGAP